MTSQELMRDGEVNRPSVEPSGLTGAREITPHATSQEDKAWERSDWGKTRGEEENFGDMQSG